MAPRIQAAFPWEARQLQLRPAGYEGLDLRVALPRPALAAPVLAQLARRSGVVGPEKWGGGHDLIFFVLEMYNLPNLPIFALGILA